MRQHTDIKRFFGIKATLLLSLAIALALAAFSAAAVAAYAAPDNAYYICYESDDYRVRAVNAMTETGDTYEISPYLSRGDRFMISDGGGRMWGDEKGQPITVKDSGNNRYTVRFSPSGLSGGGYVALEFYTPEIYGIEVDGASVGEMTYLKSQTLREEYYFYLSLDGGETVTVKSENGEIYGENGIGGDGVKVTLSGRYRFAFTADEDNLFDDGKYITFSEYPELYLLCEENGFSSDERYLLERDEDVVSYEQYRAEVYVPEKDCEFTYRVLDAVTGEEYKPSESGTVTVKDKGRYYALYSPDRIYSASGDDVYHVALSRKSEYYDGWYVLGDFNGFTYIEDSADFADKYRLVKNDEETSYDEYVLTLYIDERALSEFDGRVEFYISDGESIYRRLNGANIAIEESGEYELSFSPTHDYGRGYRYRYTRVGDAIGKRTVTVSTAAQLAEVLRGCTSPEYSLGMTVVLTDDIDLSGEDYAPALVFAGSFEGSYRTVKGVRSIGDYGNTLFREVTEDGEIRNVAFDLNIVSSERNTALIGTNYGHIENVKTFGKVDGDGYVGGIAAVNALGGRIDNCINRASVNGVMNAGGIVGFNSGRVYGCSNDGRINGKTFSSSDSSSMLNVGGIVGYSTGNILACVNSADVGNRQGRYVGGIVGLSSGGIFSCVSTATTDASSYVGGIVGYYGRFDNNSSQGGISDYLTGGRFEDWLKEYFGSDNGDFEESADNGVHEIFYCVSSGYTRASSSYAGGIAGHAGASTLVMNGLVFDGKAFARGSYVGGIVGEMTAGVLRGSISYGEATADASYAGGIVGASGGRVEHCQSSAYVSGADYVGGIVGSGSEVEGCVSYAFVETEENPAHFGLIAGEATLSACRNNYYLIGERNIGGIDGVSYGSENDYRACGVAADKLMGVGMLSDRLYGLDDEFWLSGENEPRYPIPRTLIDTDEPQLYDDKSAFASALGTVREKLGAAADVGGRTVVTVVFYTYDFDSEQYERAHSFRLHGGEGIADDDVPSVPEEEGYFTSWDRSDFSSFSSDTQVYQLYSRIVATIASDGSEKPLVLAEGRFHSDTVMTLEHNGEYISPSFTRGGESVSYGDVYIRLRVDDTEKTLVKLIRGGEIVDAECNADGDYLCFVLPEGWEFTTVTKEPSLFALWITLSVLGGAAAAAAAFIIPSAVRRAKNKKKKLEENQ